VLRLAVPRAPTAREGTPRACRLPGGSGPAYPSAPETRRRPPGRRARARDAGTPATPRARASPCSPERCAEWPGPPGPTPGWPRVHASRAGPQAACASAAEVRGGPPARPRGSPPGAGPRRHRHATRRRRPRARGGADPRRGPPLPRARSMRDGTGRGEPAGQGEGARRSARRARCRRGRSSSAPTERGRSPTAAFPGPRGGRLGRPESASAAPPSAPLRVRRGGTRAPRRRWAPRPHAMARDRPGRVRSWALRASRPAPPAGRSCRPAAPAPRRPWPADRSPRRRASGPPARVAAGSWRR